MQRQSTAADVNEIKINISSHYDSPISRRSASSNKDNKYESSPTELSEPVNIFTETSGNVSEKTINNDDHIIDVTKSINDMVAIKNECNNSANRQSNVKKRDTNICDVLWHNVSLVAWPAIDINTLIRQVVGVGPMRQLVTTETQTEIIDRDVVYQKQDSSEIIL